MATPLLPQVHVPRPDGGFEIRSLRASDILGFLQHPHVLLTDLLSIVEAGAAAYNAKGAGKVDPIGVKVLAIEAAADVAEAAKVAAEGK